MGLDKTPDMENLTPAERAAIYKQRRMAGQGGAAPAAAPAESAPAAPAQAAAPAPPAAPAQPAASDAGGPPPDLSSMSPADRAAYYKAQARARAAGAPPPAPPTAAGTPAPAPATAAAPPPAAAPTPAPQPSAAAPAPAAPKPAPKPAEPEPEPEPEEPEFVRTILDAIPDSSWQWRHGYAEIKVPHERLLDAAVSLRQAGFDYLSFVTEVDWEDRFEMLYHLYSYDYTTQPLGAILRTELQREGVPAVASLTAVWPGAEYMERESAEMMGIRFLGHPDLRKILLADEFQGFPMRKDYVPDFEYVTMKELVREFDPQYR